MAETIWKFPLRPSGVAGNNDYFAEMPAGAHPLSVGMGDEGFVVWAIVDPALKPARRWFHIAGTGHELPSGLRACPYLGRIEVSSFTGSVLQFHPFDTGMYQASAGMPISPEAKVRLPRKGVSDLG